MMIKTSLRMVLAWGLMQLCHSAMAAEAQAQPGGSVNGEFIWLAGAVVLSFCVIARRRPLADINRESNFEPDTSTGKPEQWETSGAAS